MRWLVGLAFLALVAYHVYYGSLDTAVMIVAGAVIATAIGVEQRLDWLGELIDRIRDKND